MKLNKSDNVAGIYVIENIITNKKYIGKSKNILDRIKKHIMILNYSEDKIKKVKGYNVYLYNSWKKYGKDNFKYYILETVDLNNPDFETILKELEYNYILKYDTINRKFGYNLRLDSSTKLIVHKESIQKMKDSANKHYIEHPERKLEIGKKSKEFWENNPEVKQQMSNKLKIINSKYKFEQYENGILIKTWNNISEIMEANPSYKKHNIYAVCSGEKKRIYGYVWKKIKIN